MQGKLVNFIDPFAIALKNTLNASTESYERRKIQREKLLITSLQILISIAMIQR
jgi:hypothetical protein